MIKASASLFLLLAILISILTGCKGRQNPTPQKPENPPAAQSPEDATIIAAIGDSITWGAVAFGQRAPSGGYPALLEAKLQAAGYNVVVLNKGIPGEKAYQTNDRFQSAVEGTDIALMMIGTNDIIRSEGCPEPHHCRTAEHIEEMIVKALQAHIVPIVSTVTPAQSRCARSWANPPIQALNGQIYDLAVKRNIALVDNHKAILEYQGGRIFSDCLHFNDEGYEVIAQQWFNELTEEIVP